MAPQMFWGRIAYTRRPAALIEALVSLYTGPEVEVIFSSLQKSNILYGTWSFLLSQEM